jgi:hypothetical protein
MDWPEIEGTSDMALWKENKHCGTWIEPFNCAWHMIPSGQTQVFLTAYI